MKPTEERKFFNRFICHSYYVIFGFVGVGLIPPLTKSFEDAFSISHTTMGLILGTGSITSAIASLLAGRWYDRRGARPALLFSLAASGSIAVFLYFCPNGMAFAFAICLFMMANNLGSVVNPLVRELYGNKQAGAIGLLHGFQGVGRLLAPLVVLVAVSSTGSWRAAFLLSATLYAVWVFLVAKGIDKKPHASLDEHKERRSLRLKDALLWTGVLGFAFLSGGESGLMLWLPTFVESEGGFSQSVTLMSVTCMMIGYTAVRFLLRAFGGILKPRWILFSGALLILVFALLTSATNNYWLLTLCFFLGVSFGAYFPALTAALYAYVGSGHGILTGLMLATATGGAFSALFLIGRLGDLYGLRYGLITAIAFSCIAALLYAVFYQKADLGKKQG